MRNLPITEHQQGKAPWLSAYRYIGYDELAAGHVFETSEGKREIFARRKHGPAGWYLKRGAYCFEFCASL